MLRYFVLLAIAVAVADALVCPPRICESVKCKNLDACRENSGLKIREKGGFCQCCDICVRLLGLGQRCAPLMLGVINTVECADGLECSSETGVCVASSY